LTVTETTIENKSVFVVENSKKLKACPKDQCHCPCACKKSKSGGGKSSGSDEKKSSGGAKKDKKKGGGSSKGKKGGKSHHDNGKHKGQNKSH